MVVDEFDCGGRTDWQTGKPGRLLRTEERRLSELGAAAEPRYGKLWIRGPEVAALSLSLKGPMLLLEARKSISSGIKLAGGGTWVPLRPWNRDRGKPKNR